jgi:hypothetical protein
MNMKGNVTASLLPGHPEYFQICDCDLWTMPLPDLVDYMDLSEME